jgi:hypothetical protein
MPLPFLGMLFQALILQQLRSSHVLTPLYVMLMGHV